jgi:hypothetical protein
LYVSSGIPHTKIVKLLGKLQLEDDVAAAIDVTINTLTRSLVPLYEELCVTEILHLKSGAPFAWTCVSFSAMLRHVARESKGFRDILRSLWQARPSTEDRPYHVVLYGDEVVPGNVLRLDNKRKAFCIYATIRELGPNLIKDESCWFPLAVFRTTIAKDIEGGMSHVFRVMLTRMFLTEKIGSDGVCIDLAVPGTRFATLYFALGNIVADGDALRSIWSSKGAAGKLPCILCKNVVNDVLPSAYLVGISCTDCGRFDTATDRDIWQKADDLHAQFAATGQNRDFNQLQMMYGITYSPEGLLWDRALRDVAITCK